MFAVTLNTATQYFHNTLQLMKISFGMSGMVGLALNVKLLLTDVMTCTVCTRVCTCACMHKMPGTLFLLRDPVSYIHTYSVYMKILRQWNITLLWKKLVKNLLELEMSVTESQPS